MKNKDGFTLIELLVVIAIIGILAAIAIPQFAQYKVRAFNARAQSDLRNALTAEEAYFVDTERYADCSGGDCETSLPGFVLSEDVSIDLQSSGAANSEFSGESCHTQGNRNYDWSSSGDVMTNADNGGACSASAPGSGPPVS